MRRGTEKHGPRLDDQLKHERQGAQAQGGIEPQALSDVMSRDVVALDVQTRVVEAAEAMREHDIGDVLVLRDGIVQGVVTDRDLVVRVLAEGDDPSQVALGDMCSADLVTGHPGTPVEEGLRIMRVHALRRLPVVDDEGRPQGVVSLGDLALARDPDSALADISAAPPDS